MAVLDRYIGYSIARGYLLSTAILLSVFSFFAFVEQLEDVGNGNYRTIDALIYVGLTMPQQAMELAPVATLLGSLFALGVMARDSELIAMRAAGVSLYRIGVSVMIPALILMLTLFAVGEYVAPPLHQQAIKGRSLATSGTVDQLRGTGYWSRDGRRYINVRELLQGRIPAGIDLYEFDDQGRLRTYLHARQAEIQFGGQWQFVDVEEKIFAEDKIVYRHLSRLGWKPFWTEEEAVALQLPAQSLSSSDLYSYVSHLKSTNQDPDRFELTMWQKLTIPISTVAMALVSIPFVTGALRSVSFGRRLVLGAATGIIYFVASGILANAGLLMGMHAAVITLAPAAFVVLFALVLLKRTA